MMYNCISHILLVLLITVTANKITVSSGFISILPTVGSDPNERVYTANMGLDNVNAMNYSHEQTVEMHYRHTQSGSKMTQQHGEYLYIRYANFCPMQHSFILYHS